MAPPLLALTPGPLAADAGDRRAVAAGVPPFTLDAVAARYGLEQSKSPAGFAPRRPRSLRAAVRQDPWLTIRETL